MGSRHLNARMAIGSQMTPLPAIIDGQRTAVTGFYQDHHEEGWYIEAWEYLKERRTFVQKRFIECTRYVEVHCENCNTFSFEFASILRDCGSVFGSVLDAMIKGSAFRSRRTNTIANINRFSKRG